MKRIALGFVAVVALIASMQMLNVVEDVASDVHASTETRQLIDE